MEYTDQDEITPSAEYIKNFNEGYIMAKFNTNFTNDSISNLPETDQSKGFYKGVMQYTVEKKLDKLISKKTVDRLRDTKDRSKDKEKDKDRDKE